MVFGRARQPWTIAACHMATPLSKTSRGIPELRRNMHNGHPVSGAPMPPLKVDMTRGLSGMLSQTFTVGDTASARASRSVLACWG